jgi:steroid delta-isomerase-like uncharacterized protein
MSGDENKAILRRVYELFSSGDLGALDELLTHDFVDHDPGPAQAPGVDGVREEFAAFRAAFPDLRMIPEQMVAEGDLVAARVEMTGTHSGEFMGMAPTGRSFAIFVMDLVRFEDGKAKERWGVADTGGMIEQLGLIPAPGL